MKTKLSLIAASLFASAAAWAADPAGATDEQQLKKIEQDWADAYVKRDSSFVERITVDDFAFIGPAGDIVNKAEYVKSITGDTVFTAFKLEDVKVRVYGDAAVVLGIANVSAKTKGEEENGKYSFTDVFVKQKGEWKAVSGHVTPVARDHDTD